MAVERALRLIEKGQSLTVISAEPEIDIHLAAWCRQKGCSFSQLSTGKYAIERPLHFAVRGSTAERAGDASTPVACAPEHWGLAARGALVERGIHGFYFPINRSDHIWTSRMAALYRRAAAAQWNPETALNWNAVIENTSEIEDAVVQVMTYLIENETAALIIPARFAAQVHPHYFEVMQLLAIQASDEARHIEVFSRRARLNRQVLGLSTAGGQASLRTLIDESDFSLATLLLSVLGEGSFLSLLQFLRKYAPDPLTRQICRLAAKDEARHVLFAMTHLTAAVRQQSDLRQKFAAAIRRRHEALTATAGLNEEVFYSLTLIAAGKTTPEALAAGHRAVKRLERFMFTGRVRRLRQLGFTEKEAQSLSALHTRNFM